MSGEARADIPVLRQSVLELVSLAGTVGKVMLDFRLAQEAPEVNLQELERLRVFAAGEIERLWARVYRLHCEVLACSPAPRPECGD